VAAVPAGTGMGASYRISDIASFEQGNISYGCTSHLPVLVSASYHQTRSGHVTLLTVLHPILSFPHIAADSVAKQTEGHSTCSLDMHSGGDLRDLRHGWEMRSCFQPSYLLIALGIQPVQNFRSEHTYLGNYII